MRYVSNIPPTTTSTETRQVKGLTSIHGVKPVHPREQTEFHVDQRVHPEAAARLAVEQNQQRDAPAEDRRMTQRRINHRAVVVELRSGLDRRQHHLLDETA